MEEKVLKYAAVAAAAFAAFLIWFAGPLGLLLVLFPLAAFWFVRMKCFVPRRAVEGTCTEIVLTKERVSVKTHHGRRWENRIVTAHRPRVEYYDETSKASAVSALPDYFKRTVPGDRCRVLVDFSGTRCLILKNYDYQATLRKQRAMGGKGG